MPSDDRDPAELADMLQAARLVQQFVDSRSEEEYLTDVLLRSAVERQIEIIGKAARKISTEFQNSHSEIPWRSIIAQRHVLAHEYGRIDQSLIWHVASVRIPELIGLIEPLIPPIPPDPEPESDGN